MPPQPQPMSSTRQARPVQQQLGRDVPLLGALRLVQRLAASGEIGAGILPVAVQEQGVESGRPDRSGGPRCAGSVGPEFDWRPAPEPSPDRALAAARRMSARRPCRLCSSTSSSSYRVRAERDERAVHVAFADRQRRVGHEAAHRLARSGARHPPPGRLTRRRLQGAVGIPDRKPALGHEPPQDRIEEPHRISTRLQPVDQGDPRGVNPWPQELGVAHVKGPRPRITYGSVPGSAPGSNKAAISSVRRRVLVPRHPGRCARRGPASPPPPRCGPR